MALVRDDGDVRIVTDDGVGLAVEVTGSGPALLLVHGFGGAKEDFADHVDALARDHTVIVFDHRGHGESDKPADVDAYSIARLRADVLTVADGVGCERFRLLGHSMGGMVVRGIAVDCPERVEALVLMDTSAGPVGSLDVSLMELGAEIALTQGKAALKEVLDAFPVLETPAYLRTLQERPGYQAFCDRKWEMLSEVMWASLVVAIARQTDEAASLATTTCPTLVIVGEQDETFVEPSKAMAASIPNAQLVIIPNAGHSPQFENPAAWLDAMQSFLASLVPAS
jgi:pimeloyl-ACP methyl ester carboxylesterase